MDHLLERTPDNLYRHMLRIRCFEERVLDWFPKGVFYGTTHTYIGQEANAVAVMSAAAGGDVVVSNHRCHGHFLAYGGPMVGLAAELMGRQSGICAGRGGSQHVQWHDFYANGILGGTLPLAVGMALAERTLDRGRIVIAFLGDGALGEGAVYESLNMAALWELPLMLVLENNRYAQSTPIGLNLAGDIEARFTAFGIAVQSLDSTDVEAIAPAAEACTNFVRAKNQPSALVLHTYRFAPHSKGDDSRDPAEVERYRKRDPLPLQAARLAEAAAAEIRTEVEAEVSEAFETAAAAPLAEPEQLTAALGGVA